MYTERIKKGEDSDCVLYLINLINAVISIIIHFYDKQIKK